MSRLSHCGAGSLSDAAAGRRLPTWEVTRGYVTGCLLHANRADELDALLAQWRRWWDEAEASERALRERQRRTLVAAVAAPGRATADAAEPDEPPRPAVDRPRPVEAPARYAPLAVAPGAPVAPPDDAASRALGAAQRPAWRWWPGSRTKAIIATLTLLVIGLVDDGAAYSKTPAMTGLYNVAVAPFRWVGPAAQPDLAGRLQSALFGELKHWADGVPALQLRGPQEVAAIEPTEPPARDRSFATVAREHNADVVLTGLLRPAAGQVTVTVELFLSDRTFGETPEFVGRHEISITEPVDVLGENLAAGEDLAEATLHQMKAVVEFVRGLGDYARDDFVRAQRRFLSAAEEFDLVERIPGRHTVRKEVLYLMLGNAVGRGDLARVDQAAAHYRRALSYNPAYPRARIGLAEAARAAVRCRPDDAAGRSLRLAVDHYGAALADGPQDGAANQALLQMKARLGLGLAYQCLTIGGHGDHWAEADGEFAAVLRLQAASPLPGGSARHALRLAAEARAGQALIAYTTAKAPDAARYGGYPAAARAYEEALRLLGRIDIVRPTNVERELIFLRNLRSVYQAMHESTKVAEVDTRISEATARLGTVGRGGARN